MSEQTLYKLTDARGCTRNNTHWGEGVTRVATGEGELCGPGWLHAYTHPLLAVLLNPIHANTKNPLLWEARGVVGKSDHGLKVGCTTLTTVRKIPLPEITTAQQIRFAILCVKTVCKNPSWNAWADRWLSGEDRSLAAIAAAEAKVNVEAQVVANAAWAAARAAEAAARAAARAAAWAADVAAAAWAAEAAARVAAEATDIDLIALTEQAVREEKKP
jgi:alkylhydroperoxidase/carboxymuconolactone decarboxylase family protein YurZ